MKKKIKPLFKESTPKLPTPKKCNINGIKQTIEMSVVF